MIDDDFDNIVRNMFEKFFGNSFRLNPQDSRIHIEFNPNGSVSPIAESDNGVFIDTMEYENEILVVVESKAEIDRPEAKITDGHIEMKVNSGSTKTINIEIPSAVDIEKSEMSFTNGVVEIRLVKTKGKQEEGILRVTT